MASSCCGEGWSDWRLMDADPDDPAAVPHHEITDITETTEATEATGTTEATDPSKRPWSTRLVYGLVHGVVVPYRAIVFFLGLLPTVPCSIKYELWNNACSKAWHPSITILGICIKATISGARWPCASQMSLSLNREVIYEHLDRGSNAPFLSRFSDVNVANYCLENKAIASADPNKVPRPFLYCEVFVDETGYDVTDLFNAWRSSMSPSPTSVNLKVYELVSMLIARNRLPLTSMDGFSSCRLVLTTPCLTELEFDFMDEIRTI